MPGTQMPMASTERSRRRSRSAHLAQHRSNRRCRPNLRTPARSRGSVGLARGSLPRRRALQGNLRCQRQQHERRGHCPHLIRSENEGIIGGHASLRDTYRWPDARKRQLLYHPRLCSNRPFRTSHCTLYIVHYLFMTCREGEDDVS